MSFSRASPSTASTASASARRSTSSPARPTATSSATSSSSRSTRTGSTSSAALRLLNWITYHAEKGGYDVQLELDLRTALRSDGVRRSYRFQLQGPNAMQITERVLGQAPPDLKFFNTTTLTIAGKSVGALRHGMVGQPGWELFGPWADREPVLEAILRRRRGVRAQAVGRARLLVQHGRVRLDPLAASRRVLGGQPEGVPRVAARSRLRGLGVAGREPRLPGHRGLLLHALGPRLRELRQVRPRLHRRETPSRAWPTTTTATRSRSRSTTRT